MCNPTQLHSPLFSFTESLEGLQCHWQSILQNQHSRSYRMSPFSNTCRRNCKKLGCPVNSIFWSLGFCPDPTFYRSLPFRDAGRGLLQDCRLLHWSTLRTPPQVSVLACVDVNSVWINPTSNWIPQLLSDFQTLAEQLPVRSASGRGVNHKRKQSLHCHFFFTCLNCSVLTDFLRLNRAWMSDPKQTF